jgi:glycosyltransferase involved in cell wall biosynthesis
MALDDAMLQLETEGPVVPRPLAPRKVAFVVGSLTLGGAERIVAQLAGYWAARSCEVTVISLGQADADFYETDPQVRRVWLGLSGDSGGLATALLANLKRVAALRTALSKLKPDVAIAFMTEANVLLGLAAVGLGIRTLGSERNYPPFANLPRSWRIARRFAYRLLDAVVAQTDAAANWILANTSARSAPVIPNAITLPLPRSEPAAPVTASPDARIVLCVGRLSEVKRLDRAIAAFAEAAERHPDWRLVILGDGPLRGELKDLAARLGVGDRVSFLGAVGNPGDWYAAADLFLMTSAHEGYPNALLEAMAHGRACVAVDCPVGPRELIRPGENGVLVPEGQSLAQALERCMADPALRSRLGEAAAVVLSANAIDLVAARWEAQFAKAPAAPALERIAFVVSGMGHGGAERVAANLCNHWAGLGHEVSLIVTFSGRGPVIYPLDPRVAVHFLADEGAKAGRFHRLGRLRRLLRDLAPTRVYAFMTLVNVAVLAVTRGLKTRLIVSERTYPPAQRLGAALRMARRLTYPWADTVVMQTGQGAAWMAKACPPARIVSIPNPLTAELAQAGPTVKPRDVLGSKRILLTAGRLSAEKQFPLLVDAFSLVAAERPDWDLVILGEGAERAGIEARAASHGLAARVHLPGHVGNIADWYACADAFVLTSAREGFPNALMEALAAGVPAVSLDCATGPRDLIEPGVNGFLVAPQEGAAGLAAALRQLGSFERGQTKHAAARLREKLDITCVAEAWLSA